MTFNFIIITAKKDIVFAKVKYKNNKLTCKPVLVVDIRICAEQENQIPVEELHELYFMNSTLVSLEQFKCYNLTIFPPVQEVSL